MTVPGWEASDTSISLITALPFQSASSGIKGSLPPPALEDKAGLCYTMCWVKGGMECNLEIWMEQGKSTGGLSGQPDQGAMVPWRRCGRVGRG